MKIKTTLGAILPLLFAVTASAQLKLIPGGRGNLLIGLPLALPSPVSNPVINPRIELPGFPVQITPATPIPTTLPSLIPASPLILRNGNVSGRVSPLVRSLRLRMERLSRSMTAAKQGDPKSEIFDGPTPAIPSVEVPALPETTRPGRHVYFPERELEDEIGVGVNN